MHLLAAINNNVDEWKALQRFDVTKPRLPLPYAFGGAFLEAEHSLSALDLLSKANKDNIVPFQALYHKSELAKALQSVDIAALWGSDALKAIFRQAVTPGSKKNILYFTYVFSPDHPDRKQRLYDWGLRALAGTAKGLVLMTGEQTRKAQTVLGKSVPVIRLRCGIDTAFYRVPASQSDIPDEFHSRIEKLLSEPYVIMPGDELRFNDDAIRFVEQSGIRLVRISQYGYKSGTDRLKEEVIKRKLSDRLMIFEKISYPFLRFLLQHATAYAGLVDSSWQPAGWTVACEALSSGLPVVIYDGLASRELFEAGVPQHLCQSVVMGDVKDFIDKLTTMVKSNDQRQLSEQAAEFALQNLDFSITAPVFVKDVEALMSVDA